jgi:hypothetical protein
MQGRMNWRELRAFEIYRYFTGDGSSITNRLSARTTTLMAGTISNAPLPNANEPSWSLNANFLRLAHRDRIKPNLIF